MPVISSLASECFFWGLGEEVSKTKEKVKCQEAEEMGSTWDASDSADCPCTDVCYHYCWLECRVRKYKLPHAKKTSVQVSGPVVEFSTSPSRLDVFNLYL